MKPPAALLPALLLLLPSTFGLTPSTTLKEKLLSTEEGVKIARRISRFASEASRVLFTSPSVGLLLAIPDRFHQPELPRETLKEIYGSAVAVELLGNYSTLARHTSRTPRPSANTLNPKSVLVIVDGPRLSLLPVTGENSFEPWCEYIFVVTNARHAGLSRFSVKLRGLGFAKVAFVAVPTTLEEGTKECLLVSVNAGSLRASCSEGAGDEEKRPAIENAVPFASWLFTGSKVARVSYARMLEGTERSHDFSKMENGGSTSFGGDVLDIFAKKRGLSLAKVVWEGQDEDTWESAMNRCLAGEFDIFYGTLPPPQGVYSGLVEPLAWYKFESLVFVYRPKRRSANLSSLLQPYSPTAWICTLGGLALFAGFARTTQILFDRRLLRERLELFQVFAVFLVQNLSSLPKKFGLRFVLGIWIIHNFNNAMLYTGMFSSALIAAGNDRYLRNFRDVLESGQRICGGTQSKRLLNVSYPLLRKIHDRFEEIPSIEVFGKVIEEDYIGARHVAYIERHNWINRSNHSQRLYRVDEGVIVTYPVFYFARAHHPYAKELYRIVTIAHETGLVRKASAYYRVKLAKAREDMALSRAGEQVLELHHLRVAFEALGIGLLVSGLVCLVEIRRHDRFAPERAS